MCGTGDLFDRLSEVLAEIASVPAVERGAGSGERVGQLLRARGVFEAVLLDEVACFDASGAFEVAGSPTTRSWLRAEQRLSGRDAGSLVKRSRAMRDLPATMAALRTGAISPESAARVADASLKATKASIDITDFSPFEQILVGLAADATAAEVKAATTHIFEVHGPDADQKAVEALAERYIKISPVGDLVKVDALVDKPTGEALETGIEALMARAIPKTDNGGDARLPGDKPDPADILIPDGDGRSWQQRRSDAFAELVALGLEYGAGSGDIGQHGREKPHLNVTLTLDQLANSAADNDDVDTNGPWPYLARFGRIPATTARRLACNAVYTRFITNPDGEVLDVGRASRYTNTALNKALALMHATCAYPNCTVPLRRCEIHHVTWWSNGGHTILENLVPLCRQHHRFAHEYGYQIQQAVHPATGAKLTGPRRWTFKDPRGRPIPDHRTTARRYIEQLTPPM